jgi:hypothetical protein
MTITAETLLIPEEAKYVTALLTNSGGKVLTPSINISYTNGAVYEEMLNQFLADHLCAVEYKASIDIIESKDLPVEELERSTLVIQPALSNN